MSGSYPERSSRWCTKVDLTGYPARACFASWYFRRRWVRRKQPGLRCLSGPWHDPSAVR